MTSGQREVLAALRDGPATAHKIATGLWPDTPSYTGYDRAHHKLRALEDHGLVRRLDGVARVDHAMRWTLTSAGLSALNLTS